MTDTTLDRLTLVEPDVAYRDAFVAMVEEYRRVGEGRFQAVDLDPLGFAAFVRRLRDQSRGKGLAPNWVPNTTYWMIGLDASILLGVSNLRHYLTPSLEKEGGHIGYMITPSQRCRGYGTQQLALCLENACKLGYDRVLVTCDKDNVASSLIIQKNGGILENEVVSEYSGKIVSRYWIELRRPWL